jgi:hypothetical protein
MSDASTTDDLSPPSRSGRLLSLVRKLFTYGTLMVRSIGQGDAAKEPAELTRRFGTCDILVIITRIARGLKRAGFLQEKIARAAPQIDAGQQPEPDPYSRKPRPPRCDAQPREPRHTEPPAMDTGSMLLRLPTIEQIAAKVRKQPIGAVLADLCRDFGITRDHPLWDELHAAITEFGGSFVRLVRDRLNQAFPIARIVARLKAKPEPQPALDSTGPPPAPA